MRSNPRRRLATAFPTLTPPPAIWLKVSLVLLTVIPLPADERLHTAALRTAAPFPPDFGQ
jgi:hypothetical protein